MAMQKGPRTLLGAEDASERRVGSIVPALQDSELYTFTRGSRDVELAETFLAIGGVACRALRTAFKWMHQ